MHYALIASRLVGRRAAPGLRCGSMKLVRRGADGFKNFSPDRLRVIAPCGRPSHRIPPQKKDANPVWCGWRESKSVGSNLRYLRFSEGKPVFRGEIHEREKTSLRTNWHRNARKGRKSRYKIGTIFERASLGAGGVEHSPGQPANDRLGHPRYILWQMRSARANNRQPSDNAERPAVGFQVAEAQSRSIKDCGREMDFVAVHRSKK